MTERRAFGRIARRECDERAQDGRALATAGIVGGWIGAVAALVFVAWSAVTISQLLTGFGELQSSA